MKFSYSWLDKLLPKKYRAPRYVLDRYQLELSALQTDVTDWLKKFPIDRSNQEIYLALGELFRRRGEFDKALIVHEALLKAKISEQKAAAELRMEIAQDYFAAGMLGHAEEAVRDILNVAEPSVRPKAFRLLLAVLESEQEWAKAAELIERFGEPGAGGLRLANIYCQQVQDSRNHDATSALKILRKAKKLNVGGRVDLMFAEYYTENNRIFDAISHYQQLIRKQPKRVDIALMPLKHLAVMRNQVDELLAFLFEVYQRHPSLRIVETVIDLHGTRDQQLPEHWWAAVVKHQSGRTSEKITSYWLSSFEDLPEDLVATVSKAMADRSLVIKDTHICRACGFESERMVWQCPQCQSWETLFSSYELSVEQQLKKST